MGRAPKTCSWRDPQRPSTGCAKTAIIAPNGDDFRCADHQRKRWEGATAARRRVPALTDAEKRFILERDQRLCCECGTPGDQVDHIVEVEDGGTNLPSNLQTLCRPHHDRKTRLAQEKWNDGERRGTSGRARLNRARRLGRRR